MIIQMNNQNVSKAFQKAVKQGGQLLEDGRVLLWRYSKKTPDKFIQRTISPDGSYALQYCSVDKATNTATVDKMVTKTVLKPDSYVVDTWNWKNRSGSKIEVFEKEKGANIITRVHDKNGTEHTLPDGIVYQWVKGCDKKYHEFVKTMGNLSLARMEPHRVDWAKNFNPAERLQYLYGEFYKNFNK